MADIDARAEPNGDRRREMLTVLTAEHANLQAARSAAILEANGRTTSFFAALSGALVALAFFSQSEGFRELLLPVSFVLATTVAYVGLITFVRLVQLAMLDTSLIVGINRIRNRYLELVPDIADITVLSAHDDRAGVVGRTGLSGQSASRLGTLASGPAMVAGIDGILAAIVSALGATLVGVPATLSVAVAVVVGVVTDVALFVFGLRVGARFWSDQRPRYPTPRRDS